MNDFPEVKHVAIIMDGNGRWAKKHDLPRVEGHKKGADAVENLLTYYSNLKCIFTIYL